jgi:hypothetical protein
VHDLVQLGGQFLVDRGDPGLDIGLDIFGYDLPRLDDLPQEFAQSVLGALMRHLIVRPSGVDHLIE